jgi:hypothetical protein
LTSNIKIPKSTPNLKDQELLANCKAQVKLEKAATSKVLYSRERASPQRIEIRKTGFSVHGARDKKTGGVPM